MELAARGAGDRQAERRRSVERSETERVPLCGARRLLPSRLRRANLRRFHRLNPPQAATMENVPRRGRSGLQGKVTLVNEKITEIFDFVILVKLFMLTDCTSLEEGGHGAV